MTRELALLINKALRDKTQKPFTHENGFIQLWLDERRRLHVWPERGRIVKQATDSPIHDHRFDFRSEVIRGRISHHVYKFVYTSTRLTATHRAHLVQTGAEWEGPPVGNGETLVATDAIGTIERITSSHLGPGSSYGFAARHFHESAWTGLAATVMTKEAEYPTRPRVLVPIGETPAGFDRENANAPGLLWRIIAEAVGDAGVYP